jgi:hypothetical protein
MLSTAAVVDALRTPVSRIPGVWVAIALAVTFLLAGAMGIGSSIARGQLEERIARADSTARAHLGEAVILRRDAAAERARADAAVRRSDSLAAIAQAGRADVAEKVERAAASRAAVDTAGLPTTVLRALADADSLRLAVAALLPVDSVAITAAHQSIDLLDHTIDLHVGAYAEQGAALVAREVELAALRRQHAPRCGWKCGAVIGATATALLFGGLTYLVVAAAAP